MTIPCCTLAGSSKLETKYSMLKGVTTHQVVVACPPVLPKYCPFTLCSNHGHNHSPTGGSSQLQSGRLPILSQVVGVHGSGDISEHQLWMAG